MTIIAKDLIERLQRVDPYAKVYVGKMPLSDGPQPVAHSGVVDLEPDFQTHKMLTDDAVEEAEEAISIKAYAALERLVNYRNTLDDETDGAATVDAIINMLGEI